MPSDFRTIAIEIANGIKSGTYRGTLPSISRLSKHFGVCPATIKRLLAQLRDWDLVNGEIGRCVRINPKAEGNEFFHKNIVILVSLYSVSMPFFEDTLTVLTNMLSKHYMTPHVFFTTDQIHECRFVPDCILAVSNTSQTMLEAILERFPDCPVVRFVYSDDNYPAVLPDSRSTGYEAIRHLAEDCGHTHIGIIATQLQYKNVCFSQRYEGALEYAAMHPEIKLSMVEVHELEMFSHSSFHGMEQLMANDPKITAVFASNDMLALGVYSYVFQHNLRIPEDLAVIGCDNLELCKCLMPALTSFQEDVNNVAKLLFQQFIDTLQGRKPQKVLMTKPTLIVRGSTQKSKFLFDK
ncbi:MAG: substrate-binding domain-containing protein [Victivallales bacterium]|nr:substrate-binding domain-containing protein [Victivallales bacterium]